MNFKNQKGAIVLIVLVSCMFYISSVACIQLYTQSKQASVDREYKQIKANYESSKENMEKKYNQLLEIENLHVEFAEPVITTENNTTTISEDIYFYSIAMDINSLKYGWYYSENQINNLSVNNITNWSFVEKSDGTNSIKAIKTNVNPGYYYLCLMINDKPYWMNTPIHI